MRAVIDTNVLLSGLLWRGAPHDLLEHARNGKLQLISSPALLSELAEVITPFSLMQPVCRDADDDEVLATAIAGQVDFIITGDDDLLSLKTYQEIPIITPAEAVKIMAAG